MPQLFKKILIANRGEIAVRIMRTCREMGISTVAVYSDVDSKALHVITADEAVLLGPAEPAQSYLNIEKIIKAANDTGAEAIHPGYGFLSENAAFARACQQNNIVFIGPPPEVIENMGDKIIARRIMLQNGVPVTPGVELETALNSTDQTDQTGQTGQTGQTSRIAMAEAYEAAAKAGYPVLIKAAAGGGGKGMRVVNKPEELEEACAAASSEAQTAFGDGRIYIEKYLTCARHVEFQILCDSQGNAIHLGERECSIQRRHQKIIEESPSTALNNKLGNEPDNKLRNRMGKAAVAAAKASGYINAGTVEFMLEPDGSFYFMEVNTRLQVEHPVTEMLTGVDLVRHQIEIAAGLPLSLTQEDIKSRGHAIECRIYAEDPANNFFPSPGTIQFLNEPAGPGVRNDCGVYPGSEVPVEYDPILSKLIVHAENRDLAIKRMKRALKDYAVLGVKTPIAFLIDVLNSVPFQARETFTDFINRHFSEWTPSQTEVEAAIAAFMVNEQIPADKTLLSISQTDTGSVSVWQTLGNWRV